MTTQNLKTLTIIVFQIYSDEILLCMGGATPTFPIWHIFGISTPLNTLYDYTMFKDSNYYSFRDIQWWNFPLYGRYHAHFSNKAHFWHINKIRTPLMITHNLKTLTIIVFQISSDEILLCMGGATPTLPIWHIFGILVPLNNIYDYTKFEDSNYYSFRDIQCWDFTLYGRCHAHFRYPKKI